MEGREPAGIVPAEKIDEERRILSSKLREIRGVPPIRIEGTKIFQPGEIYAKLNGIPPDLIVYLGDLTWRCDGTIGHDTLFSPGEEEGPDDANHSQNGIFILHRVSGTDRVSGGERDKKGPEEFSILDVAPTVLNLLGIEPQEALPGRIIEI